MFILGKENFLQADASSMVFIYHLALAASEFIGFLFGEFVFRRLGRESLFAISDGGLSITVVAIFTAGHIVHVHFSH